MSDRPTPQESTTPPSAPVNNDTPVQATEEAPSMKPASLQPFMGPQHNHSLHSYLGHSGKPYKHHGGQAASGTPDGSRQGYQAPANKYNNKRNYNQKSGHPKQYPQNYAYNPMYGGNYYYTFPYGQGMMPAMGQIQSYVPQLPSQGHAQLQPFQVPPAGGKIRITGKEGQQIDLEEKSKASPSSSASGTPVPTRAKMGLTENVPAAPAAATCSPANRASIASSVSDATPVSPMPPKLSAAEEFRKKIMEKAKLAQQKKEEEAKKAAEAEVLAKAAAEKAAAEKSAAEKVAAEKAAAEKAAAEKAAAEKAAAEKAAAEKAASEKQVSENEAANGGTAEKALTNDPTETKDAPEEPQSSKIELEAAGNEDGEAGENDEDVSTEHGAVFGITQFFNRLETAKFIEDPFSYSYPYPLTGVDARWKSGAKKYRYDPQFLLQFRDVVQYPIDDAWKDKFDSVGISALRRSSLGALRMNTNSKFGGQIPGGRFNGGMSGRLGLFDSRQNSRSGSKRRGALNIGSSRDRSVRNRNQSKRGRDSREKDEEPSKPAVEVVPLVPSANRWVPRLRMKTEEVKVAPDGSVLLGPEEIERKVKSALNKLTLEMFEPITEDLMNIAKQSVWEDNAQTVRQVVSLTFAKACDEPFWSSVYAQFCAKLIKEISDEVKDVNIANKSGDPATGGDLTRRILLATCQTEYTKGWVDKLPTNSDGLTLEPEMMSDEYYAMAAAKRRGLGLVKFIGNLYILGLLNDLVILHCLRDQSKNVADPSEDSLENLVQLVKTVGPKFEALERNRAALTLVYDNIQQILDNCELSLRIRFMLMDLQDLRKSNWRSAKEDAGPKTIKEIHNEAELKRIEESRAQAEKRRQNKGGYQGGVSGGSTVSRSNSFTNNSSWGAKKDSRIPTKDSRGFQAVSRSQLNRPTPDTASTASAPRENSKRTDSVASNIFAALDDHGAAN